MPDPSHERMLLQELRRRHRIRNMTVHPHPESLDPLQEQERVERTDARTHVAEPIHPALDDVRNWPERLAELHPVITRRGIVDHRKFALLPGKLAAVHDHYADAVAVHAHDLRKRAHNAVRAKINRPADISSRESIVDHQ